MHIWKKCPTTLVMREVYTYIKSNFHLLSYLKSKFNDKVQCSQRSREVILSQIINRAEHWKLKLLGDNLPLYIESHENVYKV